MVKKGLGKGLGALLPSDGIPENTKDSVVELKINDISPNEGQPRKNFNEEQLKELADSIAENGIIQPIIVQKNGTGYRIVAGERRWRAARLAGLSVIPAIVRDLTDEQVMEQALIENIQREDLNPIEEAYAMTNLLKKYRSQEKLAKRLGKPRATVANTLRLVNIDMALQEYIASGDLSAGHAKAILGLKSSEDQRKAADIIMIKELNVRQAEELVRKMLEGNIPKSTDDDEKKEISEGLRLSTKETEVRLKKILGSKVKIKLTDTNVGKGKLVIDYKDYDDLNRLIDLIGQ